MTDHGKALNYSDKKNFPFACERVLLKAVKSFYSSVVVKIYGELSESLNVKEGVRQGQDDSFCPLFFFIIFMDKIISLNM